MCWNMLEKLIVALKLISNVFWNTVMTARCGAMYENLCDLHDVFPTLSWGFEATCVYLALLCPGSEVVSEQPNDDTDGDNMTLDNV